MRILIVDDLRVLTDPEVGDDDIEYARTSLDAIERLAEGLWDEVWFDHDLGEDDDIRTVVRWVEDHRPALGCVRIISMNPVGIQFMVRALSPLYPVKIFRSATLTVP